MSDASKGYEHNNVGPVIHAGEMAEAIAEALEIDNPGKEVTIEAKSSYVRMSVEDECILRADTISEVLGRTFKMHELEAVMNAFSGQVDTRSDSIRFYMERKL